jgi:hypothetical protein
MRKLVIVFLALLLVVPAFAAKVTVLSVPTLSQAGATGATIDVKVTAGPTGAPAGFTLQWMTLADYLANGSVWPDYNNNDLAPNFCKGSFSGNANGSSYNLAPGASVIVTVGDVLFDNPGASSNCASVPLQCGTIYVFRVFAHATSTLSRSPYSPVYQFSTSACDNDAGCTFTQGYWKTHGPVPTGNNTDVWPVNTLSLGSTSYTDLQLQSIFDTPAGGNGLISLSHQLIAAKLNIANGADGTALGTAINDADSLIGGLVVPPVGSGFLTPLSTSTLTSTLSLFNEGGIGPGHCQ